MTPLRSPADRQTRSAERRFSRALEVNIRAARKRHGSAAFVAIRHAWDDAVAYPALVVALLRVAWGRR